MTPEHLVRELDATERFFDRSTSCLDEADSAFAPLPGMMTCAAQVAHVGHTIEWFVAGAVDGQWDTDWEAIANQVNAVTSLEAARAWTKRAFASARRQLGGLTTAELAAPLADNPILQGPVYHVIEAMVDHTAHHRGALTVYARLCGKTPEMPYA